MNADNPVETMNSLTARVIGAAQRVSSEMGCGFLEKIYENALAIELTHAAIEFQQQSQLKVLYKGHAVGDYTADFLVQNRLLVELKAVSGLDRIHHAQCMNYLRATGLQLCLLLNFGRPKLEVKRIANNLPE